jgi:chorismate mutase
MSSVDPQHGKYYRWGQLGLSQKLDKNTKKDWAGAFDTVQDFMDLKPHEKENVVMAFVDRDIDIVSYFNNDLEPKPNEAEKKALADTLAGILKGGGKLDGKNESKRESEYLKFMVQHAGDDALKDLVTKVLIDINKLNKSNEACNLLIKLINANGTKIPNRIMQQLESISVNEKGTNDKQDAIRKFYNFVQDRISNENILPELRNILMGADDMFNRDGPNPKSKSETESSMIRYARFNVASDGAWQIDSADFKLLSSAQKRALFETAMNRVKADGKPNPDIANMKKWIKDGLLTTMTAADRVKILKKILDMLPNDDLNDLLKTAIANGLFKDPVDNQAKTFAYEIMDKIKDLAGCPADMNGFSAPEEVKKFMREFIDGMNTALFSKPPMMSIDTKESIGKSMDRRPNDFGKDTYWAPHSKTENNQVDWAPLKNYVLFNKFDDGTNLMDFFRAEITTTSAINSATEIVLNSTDTITGIEYPAGLSEAEKPKFQGVVKAFAKGLVGQHISDT